jgi:hypothetical protein
MFATPTGSVPAVAAVVGGVTIVGLGITAALNSSLAGSIWFALAGVAAGLLVAGLLVAGLVSLLVLRSSS